LAETGSGKTLAFALPILQSLLEDPQYYYALVLAPTRELCIQISEHFEALGAGISLKTCIIVGGLDPMAQAIALQKKPHISLLFFQKSSEHQEDYFSICKILKASISKN
jgi:ATP-dependent RNA helicase DDX47/RRP3